MSKRIPDPWTLVIFGASGDLTRRKLVPALYGLFRDRLLPDGFALVGFARSALDENVFRAELAGSTKKGVRPGTFDDRTWQAFASRIRYLRGNYDVEGLRVLREALGKAGSADHVPGSVLYDLATPPAAFGGIVEALRDAGLVHPVKPDAPWSRIIVEKPFGHDLESARELNRRLRSAFAERQIFRMDHYLGKETVQNILVLRFANSIFEPIWNQKYIDHVQITVSETIGVEGRGGYYDQTGAIRDILQNHMMHLLCFVAMEPPMALDAGAVRDEKVKLLRALRPIPRECVPDSVVRARYAPGRIEGEPVSGYLEEPGVRPDSSTETYVALKTFVDNWRWAGVPFYLRTGKRVSARVTEIAIHFKSVPQVLFNADAGHPLKANVLAVRIQPNEGISLRFEVKVPGPGMKIEPFQMDFGYVSAFGTEPPEAYSRLILDASLGDSTLFIRDDEVEAAWSFLAPLIECRDEQTRPERSRGKGRTLPDYPAGSWGPEEADRLIEADGRHWEMMKRPLKR